MDVTQRQAKKSLLLQNESREIHGWQTKADPEELAVTT